MTVFVNCKALAASLVKQRQPRGSKFTELLAARFCIDTTQTLAEIEGIDASLARDWGDLAKLHALHYVPLERFTPADVMLMLTYGQSPQIMLALARQLLERDPVMRAEHHAGDLLLNTAYLVAFDTLNAPCSVNGHGESPDAIWIRERIEAAEQRVQEIFEARAEKQGDPSVRINASQRRVRNGPSKQPPGRDVDLDNLMHVIAEARAWIDPPRILQHAYPRHHHPDRADEATGVPLFVPPPLTPASAATAAQRVTRPNRPEAAILAKLRNK